MTDEIRLVIPAEEDFRSIAHLVTGGLALRLDLTYEDLEDLQVALEALLGLRDDEGELVVSLSPAEDVLRAAVGPFDPAALQEDEEDGASDLDLRRVLDTVCDTHEMDIRDDGAWVELTKKIAAAAGAAG
ncbi:MAG TPA: hypothetical protein VE088_06860 [Gaiellaceae bacterium]|jgi:hypothetical protein|nr:hypothetical protein [Gaiellaceae bacterium]